MILLAKPLTLAAREILKPFMDPLRRAERTSLPLKIIESSVLPKAEVACGDDCDPCAHLRFHFKSSLSGKIWLW